MAWGIIMTGLTLVGMLTLLIFEATTADEREQGFSVTDPEGAISMAIEQRQAA